MMPLPSIWPWLLVAGISAAGGYALAAKIAAGHTAQAETRLARCEAARAEDARATAEQTAALLARAQDAEAQAAARLARQQEAFNQRLKEARSEIYSLATGRECLSGALRLRLNAVLAADDLPARAGGADPAHAASSADPILPSPPGRGVGGEGAHLPSPPGRGAGGEGATDADIAHWILDAARAYDDCRARLDAIRHWDEVTHGR